MRGLVAMAAVAMSLVGLGASPASADPSPPPVINMSSIPYAEVGAVQAFETNAVNEVLAKHELPAGDFDAVLGWGRNDVRAQEWSDLVNIMTEDPSQRSANDDLVLQWFESVYHDEQVQAAQDAISEYERWSGRDILDTSDHPLNFGPDNTGYCNYAPPGGPTGPYAGTYTGNEDQTCFTPCTTPLGCTAPYPDVAQFEEWGAFDADEQTVDGNDFTNSAYETVASVATLGSLVAGGVAAGATAGIASALYAAGLVGAGGPLILYTAASGSTAAAVAAQTAAAALNGAAAAARAAAFVASAAAVAGTVTTVIFAAVTIGLAIYQIVKNASIAGPCVESNGTATSGILECDLQNAQGDSTFDLGSVYNGSTQGPAFLYGLFLAQTMPDVSYDNATCGTGTNDPCANAPAIPGPSSSDPVWLITTQSGGVSTSTISRSIYTLDPFAPVYESTQLSGNGWFVGTKYDAADAANMNGPSGPPGASFESLQFIYTDWQGVPMVAERSVDSSGNPVFVTAPLDSSGATQCTAPQTAAGCITNTIEFVEPDGTEATAEVLPASAVTPSVSALVPTTAPVGTPIPFTATAQDPNGLPLTYSWLFECPGAVSPIVGFVCDLDANNDISTTELGSSVSFTFNEPGVYKVQVTASDSLGFSATQSYSVQTIPNTSTTLLSSEGTSLAFGEPTTLSAIVSPVACDCRFGGGIPLFPSGSVQFSDDGVPLGSPVPVSQRYVNGVPTSDGIAELTTSLPFHGGATDSLTATFTPGAPPSGQLDGVEAVLGSEDTLADVTVGVGQLASTVTPSWGTSPALPVYGQPITFTATVAPQGLSTLVPSGQVQFTVDGTDVGQPVALDGNGQAQLTLDSLPVTPACGIFVICLGHTVGVVYTGTDDGYALTQSNPATGIYVAQDATTTTVTPVSGASYATPTTLTAEVAAVAPGTQAPVGDVQFTVDGADVGSPVPVDPSGTATLSTTLTATGPGTGSANPHTVGATFLGSTDFVESSNSESVSVAQAPLSVTPTNTSMTFGGTVPPIPFQYGSFVGSDGPSSLATQPTCTASSSGHPVSSSTLAGQYPITCSGGVAANYSFSYGTGTFTINPSASSITYTGGTEVYPGASVTTSSQLTTAVTACRGGVPITYSLDTNPTTGGAGTYVLGTTPTSSSGASSLKVKTASSWRAGAYVVMATASSTLSGSCAGSTTSGILLVQSSSAQSYGAGTYTVPGVGPVSFGASLVPAGKKNPASGSVSVVDPGSWLLKGSVNSMTTANRGGTASGSGSLFAWNRALNGGIGGWQLAGASVAFTATFSSTIRVPPKSATPGSFGVSIAFTPGAGQPPMPNSGAETLTSGSMFVP